MDTNRRLMMASKVYVHAVLVRAFDALYNCKFVKERPLFQYALRCFGETSFEEIFGTTDAPKKFRLLIPALNIGRHNTQSQFNRLYIEKENDIYKIVMFDELEDQKTWDDFFASEGV